VWSFSNAVFSAALGAAMLLALPPWAPDPSADWASVLWNITG
jgi:hypothetical protein